MKMPSNKNCGCNVQSTVPAGAAGTQPCDSWNIEGAQLATINFPIQEYEYGLCPCEALECGTLFPELVM